MDEDQKLNPNVSDVISSLVKAGANLVPYAGPFIAEIVGNLIPNQRLDRVTKFLEILNSKIESMKDEIDILRLKTDNNLLILFEKSLICSTQTNSKEKYYYYSDFVVSCFLPNATEQMQKERILSILSELNDIEVLHLIYYSFNPTIGMQNSFISKYKDVLFPHQRTMNEPMEHGYNDYFKELYLDNLERLRLIHRDIEVDRNTKMPIIDIFTKQFKKGYASITPLGMIIAQFIGAEKYKDA